MKPFPSAKAFIAIALVACAAHGGPVVASSVPSRYLPVGEIADAPTGFIDLCKRDPATCLAGMPAPHLPRPGALTVMDDEAMLALIRHTNSRVNRSIVQITDFDAKGVYEYWERPAPGNGNPIGDCEDIAIEKRMRLVAAGFPAERLFYAAAFKRGFGLHVVLVARLDAGDMVLDSLTPHVLHWSKVRYSWLRIQSTDNPLVWMSRGDPQPERPAPRRTLASNSLTPPS